MKIGRRRARTTVEYERNRPFRVRRGGCVGNVEDFCFWFAITVSRLNRTRDSCVWDFQAVLLEDVLGCYIGGQTETLIGAFAGLTRIRFVAGLETLGVG